MDEPFAALDALTRRKMQEELAALWDDVGFTVIFVTHSIEEALLIGNRILVMSPHPGQVKAELNAGHLGFADLGTRTIRTSESPYSRFAVLPTRSRPRSRAVSGEPEMDERTDRALPPLRPEREMTPEATGDDRRRRPPAHGFRAPRPI